MDLNSSFFLSISSFIFSSISRISLIVYFTKIESISSFSISIVVFSSIEMILSTRPKLNDIIDKQNNQSKTIRRTSLWSALWKYSFFSKNIFSHYFNSFFLVDNHWEESTADRVISMKPLRTKRKTQFSHFSLVIYNRQSSSSFRSFIILTRDRIRSIISDLYLFPIMTDRSFKNRNTGERSSNRQNINSPVNNNEQFSEDDHQNQIDDDEVVLFYLTQHWMQDHFLSSRRKALDRQHQTSVTKNMAQISVMKVWNSKRTFRWCSSKHRDCLALCPDLAAERPQEHESLSNVIIIDNLPKVDPGRLEKLKVVIAKVYNEFGGFRNSYFPTDEEEKTKGWFEVSSENKKPNFHMIIWI